ncbi:hypothetical protein [Mesorhizobium sp. M1405]|uniref:hypothetical protein n=1 Tax=Mesorhizobium sp. M1405 TaxID=2957098 RepID=UPI00333AF648
MRFDGAFGDRRVDFDLLDPEQMCRAIGCAGCKKRPRYALESTQYLTLPICNQIHANVRVTAPNPDIVSAQFPAPEPAPVPETDVAEPAHARQLDSHPPDKIHRRSCPRLRARQ